MPNAIAPKAPCVEVCESPQTIVMPGWVRPSRGPTTWTMPLLDVTERVQADAELLGVASAACPPGSSTRGPRWACPSRACGTLWSSVARVRSGRRTLRPQAKAVERLRGRHLVDKVQIDEEQVGLTLGAADDVLVPDFFRKRPTHIHFLSASFHMLNAPSSGT